MQNEEEFKYAKGKYLETEPQNILNSSLMGQISS